jgi:hypothetical protein
MDGWNFILTAEGLCRSEYEHDLRTCISRCYFAALNELVERLAKHGIRIHRNAQGHGELLHYLTGCGLEDLEAAGRGLDSLRSKRNRADYDMDHPPQEHNQTAVNLAMKEAKLVRQSFLSVPIDDAVSAIRGYIEQTKPPR